MHPFMFLFCLIICLGSLLFGILAGKELGARTVIDENLCVPVDKEHRTNSTFKFVLAEGYTAYICNGKVE